MQITPMHAGAAERCSGSCLHVGPEALPRFKAVETAVAASRCVQGAVVIHYVDYLQAHPLQLTTCQMQCLYKLIRPSLCPLAQARNHFFEP